MARTLDMTVPTSPFLDANLGDIAPSWRAFLTVLLARTGGSKGTGADAWVLPLQQEASARSSADRALGVALAAETAAREAGDAAHIGTGDAAGGDLTGFYPNPQLAPGVVCSYWALCDLSGLPTSDPGHGRVWLNGGVLTVGTPTTTAAHITLEDASGNWATESGGGTDWVWG